MPEYIEREMLTEAFEAEEADDVELYGGVHIVECFPAERATEIANGIPAADVVAVVRCGECERRCKSADLTDSVYCPWLKLQMRKNDFCSYGERRGEDEP